MPTHYIKFLPRLGDYIGDAAGGDWREALFRDLSDGGRRLRYRLLPDNENGPRVAFQGSSFYAEAGLDRVRSDTIFVFHAKRLAGVGIPQGGWKEWAGVLIPQKSGSVDPPADVVALFHDGSLPAPEGSVEPRDSVAPAAAMSPRLRKLLQDASSETRRRFRPGTQPTPPDASVALMTFRSVWSRHRLDQAAVQISPRAAGVLSESITPPHLGPKHIEELASVFDIAFLNVIAFRRHERPAEFYQVLDDLSELPLAGPVRAQVWSTMLRGLEPAKLSAELHDVAAYLKQADDGGGAAALSDALMDTLRGVAVMRDIVAMAESDEEPLRVIAEWAAKLQVAEAPRESAPPPPPQFVQARSETTPDRADAVLLPALTHDAFERWVLRLRVPDITDLDEARATMSRLLGEVLGATGERLTLTSLRRLRAALDGLQPALDEWRKRIPSLDELASDEAEARAAIEESAAALGGDLSRVVELRPTPAVVRDIAEVLRRKDVMVAMPAWVWMSITREGTGAGIPLALLNPVVRERAKFLIQLVDELGSTAIDEISMLPPLVEEVGFNDYVEEKLRAAVERRRRLLQLTEAHRAWADSLLGCGHSVDEVLGLLPAMDDLQQRLSRSAFDFLVASMRPNDLQYCVRLTQRFDVAAREYQDKKGKPAHAASAEVIEVLLPTDAEAPAASADIALEHNFVDETGSRASLHLVKDSSEPWGVVRAPLQFITSARPSGVALSLSWSQVSPKREGWPAAWPGIEPTEVRIAEHQWRSLPENDGRWRHTFVVQMPMRPPAKTPSFGVKVDVSSTSHPSLRRSLEWENVRTAFSTLVFEWQDELDPAFVIDHPIGPQKGKEELHTRIRSGSSFAVLAPRRFGKSTLLQHLYRLHGCDLGGGDDVRTARVAVAEPVSCATYASGSGLDWQGLWDAVSTALTRACGTGLKKTTGELPGPDAFEAVRKLASTSFDVVVVLLDEAQAIFPPGPDGARFGTRLKDLLEQHWAKTMPGGARLVIGLIGLPGMRERAGANLMDKLRPIEEQEIAEDDLGRLLRKVTQGALQTTRAARLHIASLSRNLAIAREIVERLVARANNERRAWITYDDVKVVENEIVNRLRQGQQIFVSSLRDVFNMAETVDEWRPNELFSVGVAIAHARAQGARSQPQVIEKAVHLLTAWAEQLGDTLRDLTFSDQGVAEHVAAMQEAGIIKQFAFTSPLVEAWLMGQCSSSSEVLPEAFRTSLVAAAVPQLRRPETLEPIPIAEGAEAQVFRFTREGKSLVWRQGRRLETERDRAKFAMLVQTMDALVRRTSERKEGFEGVFDLQQIGLYADGRGRDWYGVQVYTWINGFDLGERIGQLSPLAVARIGFRLAQAVALLHQENILHRDIQPKNVIVQQDSVQPVLIDFGLAKIGESTMLTRQSSGFGAPEVRAGIPRWSRASDVWSLGETLRELLNRELQPSADLARVLDAACHDEPAERPSAAELAVGLKDLEHRLQSRQSAGARFDEQVLARCGDPKVRSVVEKFRPRFEACLLGLYPAPELRAVEAADFLNQVIEAKFPGNGRGVDGDYPPSLGSFAFHENKITGKLLMKPSVRAAAALRNWRSHAKKESIPTLMTSQGIPSGSRPRDVLRDAASVVAKALNIADLEVLVDGFFMGA